MSSRREFITLFGGAAAAWPLVASAQQSAKTIGFLGASTRSAEAQWIAALVRRLRELGWIEGRNLAIEYRWAEGDSERSAQIAAEFVRLKVDVIVTWGSASVVTTKQATSVIPIVFAASGDPLGTGLIGSLARPGGGIFITSKLYACVPPRHQHDARRIQASHPLTAGHPQLGGLIGMSASGPKRRSARCRNMSGVDAVDGSSTGA